MNPKVRHHASSFEAVQGLVRPDIDIPIAINLLNSALTSIARWYRPTDRLKPDQIHDQVMKVLHGLLLPQQPTITAPS
jgi:TetR/AcrR family transcriptional regulator, cholesterol catabolism regulator